MTHHEKRMIDLDETMRGSLSRRSFLRRSAILGLSVPALGGLLAACGDEDEPAPAPGVDPDPDDDEDDEPVDDTDDDVDDDVDETPAVDATTVVLAHGVDATYLDPQADGSGVQGNIHEHTHDTLYHFDRNQELNPRLAESLEIPDETTYIFHLRQGVLFHDGTEFTAEDAKFSFERCIHHLDTALEINVCDMEPFIDEIVVHDDYTVEMQLQRADATFLARVPRVWIVPENAVRELGPDEYNQRAIGSGAYQVREWARDQHLTLDRFDDYWGPAPIPEVLVIRPIPEASTRISALRAGEVDIIVNVPPDSIPLIEESENARVEISDGARLIFIYLNTYEPPFDNVLVRRAVNHAVNWDEIIEHVLGGEGIRTPCPITPYDFPYDAIEHICHEKAMNYDPDLARELLAEAGYEDGFDLELEGPDGRYLLDAEVLQAVAGYLDEVGIRTTTNIQEWGIYYQERFFAGVVKAGLFGMGNPLRDIDHLMAVHFDPDRRSIYYTTDRLKELIDAGVSTPFEDERIEIYTEAMEIIMDDAPWIFGYSQMNVFGVSNRLDWTPRAGGEVVSVHDIEGIN